MHANYFDNSCVVNQWANTSQECNLSSGSFPFQQGDALQIQLSSTFDNHAASECPRCFSSLCICFIFMVFMTLWTYRRKTRMRHPKVLPVDAVHALSAVFTPTSSAWPAKFAYYFESASITRGTPGAFGGKLGLLQGDACIAVDLSALVGHVLAGDIELRDPRDLGPLLKGSLKMYAWTIRLTVGWGLWLEVARWLALQHVFSGDWTVLLQDNLVAKPTNFIDLDFIPFRSLDAYIRGISNHRPPPSSITVEFSSIKSEIRFMSPEFLLCGIALLPSWKGRKISRAFTRDRPLKSSTLLFVQLQDVVACITSTKLFNITSITNISAQREASLLLKERDLAEKKDMRTCAIREVGTRGWREERLRLGWEAGLIRAGLLQRWSIQLST